MKIKLTRANYPFASELRISYRVITAAETVLVELTDGERTGRGEALGVPYHGETADSIYAQLTAIKETLEAQESLTRAELERLLPPGGARNAVDCALWDLEAKHAGRRAWELAGIPVAVPLTTAFTLGLASPESMAQAARAARQYSILKLKLAGEGDVERVAAVRKAHPRAEIIVDANQAWNERHLRTFTPRLAELGVTLIEQPLAVGQDGVLEGFKSPVPLCADESCQTSADVRELVSKYQYVNIKLDKTGGLTEALRLARLAQSVDLKLMVGCMGGSSLSMSPAFIIGQLASVVDLDGPLLATADIPHAIRYQGSRMYAPSADLWG